MPATVLGKRTRSTAAAEGTAQNIPAGSEARLATTETRSKRRVVLNEPHDENENPFKQHDRDTDAENEGLPAKKKTRTAVGARSVPAKHGAPEQRVAVSPSKIDGHFKVGKSAITVFEDDKTEPSTPPHRDALSKKVPITPRHRVLLAGGHGTPRTPRTAGTPSHSSSVYHQARQLFSRCSAPGRLVGRDEERKELSGFVDAALESKSAGCLYVSGPPGTGKSALVGEVMEQYKEMENVNSSVVNCMSVRSAKDLSGKLSEDLSLQEDAGFDYLRSCFVRGKAKDTKKYLVILDEVDRLVDLDLALLYGLFEWSMQPSSRLILIGIANALDLTDRFLPRLKSRNLKPELLPFMPYTAAQIAGILTSKLKTLFTEEPEAVPFLQPAAIQFCAKKVAGQTGDLRKAFDICRRAIDLVDQETREKDAGAALQGSPSKMPLMENINLSSPPTPRSPSKKTQPAPVYTAATAPKATIAHMAKVTAQAFSNGTTQRLTTLNLQQKAVLCTLSALEKRKRDSQLERTVFATPSKHNSTAPSVKELYETYSSLCTRNNLLHPLTATEFRDVVGGLETLGLVSGVDGKGGSLTVPRTPSRTPSRKGRNGGFGAAATTGDDRRIASAIGRKELSAALEGVGGELLRDVLEGEGI